MPPEDELAFLLSDSKSANRRAVYALHQNLLLRNDLQLLLEQAQAIRQQAQQTCESAVLVREDARRKLSVLDRTRQSAAR